MRAAVEALENRVLLSTVVVNSVLDTLFPVGSPNISLRNAVEIANKAAEPTTITFDKTVFATKQTIVLSGSQLELSNTAYSTTITGPGADRLAISGNDKSRVLEVDAGATVNLSGVTITHGDVYAASVGDHAWLDSAGGGIISHGTLTMTNAAITRNHGGIAGGGGIANYGTAVMRNVTISNNHVDTPVYAMGGDGGGLLSEGSTYLTNVTITGNSVTDSSYGGGIDVGESNLLLQIVNSTITNNTASASFMGGGGICLPFNAMGTTTLANSIVAGNHLVGDAWLPYIDVAVSGSGYWTGTFESKGNNLIGTAEGGATWLSSDLTGTLESPLNPLLGPLTYNGGPMKTMMPLPGSPALDHGSNALIPAGVTSDQRGYKRIVNGIVDIGAVERHANVTLPAAPNELTAKALSATSVKLTWKDNSFNEDRFKIEVSLSASGPWTQVTTAGTNATACTITGLTAGKTHYFRVRANNGAGNSGYSNVATVGRTFWNVAGTLDTGFGVSGFSAGGIGKFVLLPDGSFYSGLTHYSASGQRLGTVSVTPVPPPLELLKLPTGLIEMNVNLEELGVTPAGKVIAAGVVSGRRYQSDEYPDPEYYTQFNHILVERFNADGTLDTTFGANGFLVFDDDWGDAGYPGSTAYFDFRVAGTLDGRVLLAYQYDNSASSSGWVKDGRIVEISQNGEVLTQYFASVRVADIDVRGDGIAAITNLDYTAAAWWSGIHHVTPAVSLLSPAGNRATALPADSVLALVAVAHSDKIAVAGKHSSGGLYLARFNADLTPDLSFAAGGMLELDQLPGFALRDIVVQGDEKIVLSGHFGGKATLVRFDTAGNIDPTFGERGLAQRTLAGGAAFDKLALTPLGNFIVTAGNGVMQYFGDPGKITGTCFDDKNTNGKRDAGEPLLVSSMVYIDKNNNGVFDVGEANRLTDAAGNYSFNLAPGTYRLRKYLRPGYLVSLPAPGYYDVTLAAGDILTGKDFGHTFKG